MNLRRFFSSAALVIGALIFSIGLQAFAQTYAEPTSPPPPDPSSVNAYAPLDTGPNPNTKTGPLQVNGFSNIGTTYLAGNVGVGTVNPTALLSVQDPNPITIDTELANFGAHGSASGVGYITLGSNDGSGGGFVGWDYTNGVLGINAHAAGGPAGGIAIKRVDNGHSNVGIGTVSPAGKLDVEGGNICLNGSCIGSWPTGGGGNVVSSVNSGTGISVTGSQSSPTVNVNEIPVYQCPNNPGNCPTIGSTPGAYGTCVGQLSTNPISCITQIYVGNDPQITCTGQTNPCPLVGHIVQ
ncbi:MAG: hypothetical protein ACYC75_00200 [Minisyncoccota bacterium]